MSKGCALKLALDELCSNPDQWSAVHAESHCVILAGPGSGKTKTLTVAMARVLESCVTEPRGIACLTYNNECVSEIEGRLKRLGVTNGRRCYVGTFHAFAFTNIIIPFGRCFPFVPGMVKIAEDTERTACKTKALAACNYSPNSRSANNAWVTAERHRRVCTSRDGPPWHQQPQAVVLIQQYEEQLRQKGLLDFEDIALLALRMLKDAPWLRRALSSKFPILFVDEYQDLGYALHEMVQLLCFQDGAMRLFAVGDPDQSIYGFNCANPAHLVELAGRTEVAKIRLKLNYRSTASIIAASQEALGESREYRVHNVNAQGKICHHAISSDLTGQANYVVTELLPQLVDWQIKREQIAMLYREAQHGDELARVLEREKIPFMRSDKEALIKRNCAISRFMGDCVRWATTGWTSADPSFDSLRRQALRLCACRPNDQSKSLEIETALIQYLRGADACQLDAGKFLSGLQSFILQWSKGSPSINSWKHAHQLLEGLSSHGNPMTLLELARKVRGEGMHPLSTFHSSKGREFQAVILFNLNRGIIPNSKDLSSEEAQSESRRLFYVAVSRAKTELHLIYRAGEHSPWVEGLEGFRA